MSVARAILLYCLSWNRLPEYIKQCSVNPISLFNSGLVDDLWEPSVYLRFRVWKPGIVDHGLVVTDVLHILYSQRSPHRFPVNASAPALHLVPLSSASSYPKYPWQAPQHTCQASCTSCLEKLQRAKLNMTKLAGFCSAPSSPSPVACVPPQCPKEKSSLCQSTWSPAASCWGQRCPNGASGRHNHKSCRRSLVPLPCQRIMFWGIINNSWKESQGGDDHFYKRHRTIIPSWRSWCSEKKESEMPM